MSNLQLFVDVSNGIQKILAIPPSEKWTKDQRKRLEELLCTRKYNKVFVETISQYIRRRPINSKNIPEMDESYLRLFAEIFLQKLRTSGC